MVQDPAQSGRDRYDAIYRKDLAAEVEWLRMGATDKTDSVKCRICGDLAESLRLQGR
jgi:hypothetical protein